MVQYLANSKFYFEIDGVTALSLKTINGPEIEMDVAGGDSAIGVSKDAKTQTQATIGGGKVQQHHDPDLCRGQRRGASKTLEVVRRLPPRYIFWGVLQSDG